MKPLRFFAALCAVAFMTALVAAPVRADPPEVLITWYSWQPAGADEVKAQAMKWLEEQKADQSTRAKAAALWAELGENPPEDEILLRLAGTFALADPKAAALVKQCSKPKDQLKLPDQSWLKDVTMSPLLAANMRLIYARWLIQSELFDEALEQVSGLNPGDVAAPASLLFYQAVIYHELLEKETGQRVIANLLDNADKSPRRYIAVARLMQEDLDNLKNDTLDLIARQMNDVRRRLEQGQAGKKVQNRQDGIMEGLQRMIQNIERQQDQQRQIGQRKPPQQGQKRDGQQQAKNRILDNPDPQDAIQSDNPLPDSIPMEGKGPGEIAKKDIGNKDDWGNLDPKDREETLQQIGRDFPSHYRDVMEQYFRRLAAEGSEEP
jgi:hypothetical protein